MKRKVLILLLMLGVMVSLTGCLENKKESKDGKTFKEDYEELNGKENKLGKKYRIIFTWSLND